MMKIRMTVEGRPLRASLDDGPAARDFAALLPLTLQLEDYAGTEKIAQLKKKLSTRGEPAGFKPIIGDITYYAPWGNLAIFYRDFGYADGLVKLGHIDDEIDLLRAGGSLQITIEREEA